MNTKMSTSTSTSTNANMGNMAQVAILLDRATAKRRWQYGLNVFDAYISQILTHAGIPYRELDHIGQLQDERTDILIVALESGDPEAADAIWQYVEAGGTVISYAGLAALLTRLGCTAAQMTGAGYADVAAISGETQMLRYLQASPWHPRQTAADIEPHKIEAQGHLVKETRTGQPLCSSLLSLSVGEGFIERWAVNISETIVQIQQGSSPVLKDGVPAPDGTAAVNEGILKADDGIMLDWQEDRTISPTGIPYFATPHADLWREVLISHLLQTALRKHLTLPFIGYWPEGITQVAMISHDSDLNEDAAAETTLRALAQAEIQSTWCMIEPGYSPLLYDQIKQAGHELAFHYNALSQDDREWSQAEFARQHYWFKTAAGVQETSSNKNHYTRFEGWGELFSFCESQGILSDQTRGPSKKGNVGFLFGTCQPYFPIAWWDEQNRTYDVVEIGFLTQDLDINVWADRSVVVPFLEQAAKVEGVAHFLFHQHHLHHKETAYAAFLHVVETAKQRGFTFWTGKQVNDWVRARRKVHIIGIAKDGAVVLKNRDSVSLPMVVWVPVDKEEGTLTQPIEIKFGVPCKKLIL